MNKSDLIITLSKKFPEISHIDTAIAVNVILTTMSKTLIKHDRIEIRGFGSFIINYRAPRKARNPKTVAPVLVDQKAAPHFKAGLELKHRINESIETAIHSAA